MMESRLWPKVAYSSAHTAVASGPRCFVASFISATSLRSCSPCTPSRLARTSPLIAHISASYLTSEKLVADICSSESSAIPRLCLCPVNETLQSVAKSDAMRIADIRPRLSKIGTAPLRLAGGIRIRIRYRLERCTRDKVREYLCKILHGDFAVGISDIIGFTTLTVQQYLKKAGDCITDIAERTRLSSVTMDGNGVLAERLVSEHRNDTPVSVTHAGTVHIEGADADW